MRNKDPEEARSLRVNCKLGEDLSEAVRAYMRSTGQNICEATRDLIRQALAANPETGAIRAAADRAFGETRAWCYAELIESIAVMERKLKHALGSGVSISQLNDLPPMEPR